MIVLRKITSVFLNERLSQTQRQFTLLSPEFLHQIRIDRHLFSKTKANPPQASLRSFFQDARLFGSLAPEARSQRRSACAKPHTSFGPFIKSFSFLPAPVKSEKLSFHKSFPLYQNTMYKTKFGATMGKHPHNMRYCQSTAEPEIPIEKKTILEKIAEASSNWKQTVQKSKAKPFFFDFGLRIPH